MAENRYKRAEKVFLISLGAGCRRFESCHSDHLSWKSRLKRRFFCVSGVLVSAYPQLSVLLYTAPAMMEPYRKGRCGSCFITANEVIAGSSTRKRVFSSAALPRRRSERSRRCPRHLTPGTGFADAAIPSSVSIEKSRWLS